MVKPCLEQWSLPRQPSCQAVKPMMSNVQYLMLKFCLDQWSLIRQPSLLAGTPTISTGFAKTNVETLFHIVASSLAAILPSCQADDVQCPVFNVESAS